MPTFRYLGVTKCTRDEMDIEEGSVMYRSRSTLRRIVEVEEAIHEMHPSQIELEQNITIKIPPDTGFHEINNFYSSQIQLEQELVIKMLQDSSTQVDILSDTYNEPEQLMAQEITDHGLDSGSPVWQQGQGKWVLKKRDQHLMEFQQTDIDITELQNDQDLTEQQSPKALTPKVIKPSQQARKRLGFGEVYSEPKKRSSIGYVSFRESKKRRLAMETDASSSKDAEVRVTPGPEIPEHDVEVNIETMQEKVQTSTPSPQDSDTSLITLPKKVGIAESLPGQPSQTEKSVPLQSKLSRINANDQVTPGPEIPDVEVNIDTMQEIVQTSTPIPQASDKSLIILPQKVGLAENLPGQPSQTEQLAPSQGKVSRISAKLQVNPGPEIPVHDVEVNIETMQEKVQTSNPSPQGSDKSLSQEVVLAENLPGQSLQTEQPAPLHSKVSRKSASDSSETPLGSLDRTKVSLGKTDNMSYYTRFVRYQLGIEDTMIKIMQCIKRGRRNINVDTLLEEVAPISGPKALTAARCFISILKLAQHGFIKVLKYPDTSKILDVQLLHQKFMPHHE